MKRIALLALVALVWVCLAATASRAYAPSDLPVRVVSYDEGGMVRSSYLPRIEARDRKSVV